MNFRKIKEFIIRYKYLLILIGIALVTHWIWFFKFDILSASDWKYFYEENLSDYFSIYYIWDNVLSRSLGNVVVMVAHYPIRLLYGFFANIWSYAIAERIVYLFPIILLAITSSYFFIKKITKSDKAAFIGALLYSFNTYFIKLQNSHLIISLAYALAPFVFLSFIKLLEKKTIKSAVIFALLFSLTGFYELRILYIIFFILVGYLIFYLITNKINKKDILKYLKLFLIIFVVYILLNSFWLIVFNVTSEVYTGLASRSLFGNEFLNILYSLSFFYPFWSNGKIIPFVNQNIQIISWLIPIFAFLSILFWKKNKSIIYFILISLLGILLVKQASGPFPGLYLWLYEHVPGFRLFREASKFYILIAIGYSVLFGYMFLIIFNYLKNKNKYLSKLFFFTIVLILLVNSFTLISGYIDGMFVGRKIPQEYLDYRKLVSSQEVFFRVLWIPGSHNYSYFDSRHPAVNFNTLNMALGLDKYNYLDALEIFIKANYINNLAIKYIALPYDSMNQGYYDNLDKGTLTKQNINDFLSRYHWLERIDLTNENMIVYENTDYKFPIYSSKNMSYLYGYDLKGVGIGSDQYINKTLVSENSVLNSQIVDKIIIPVETRSEKISNLKTQVQKGEDILVQSVLSEQLNYLTYNIDIDNYKLQIPKSSTFRLLIDENSILNTESNVMIKIEDQALVKKELDLYTDWVYFNEIDLEVGEHDLDIYIDNKMLESLPLGDMILLADNLTDLRNVPQIEYRKINPTKYVINVYNAVESFPLIFSESYHSGWKIYIDPSLKSNNGNKFVSENKEGTIQNKNLESGKYYDLFNRTPVLDENHFMVNGLVNAWWIDLKQLADRDILFKDEYGNNNFSIIVEFAPQKRFLIGILISGLSLIICLSYLLLTICRKSNK